MYSFWLSVTSNQSHLPSSLDVDERLLLLPQPDVEGGEVAAEADGSPASRRPQLVLPMWMPRNTSPSVTIARYRPRSRTATGRDDDADQRRRPTPAPGSQIQIGSSQPIVCVVPMPPEHRAGVGTDAHEERVAE